MEPEEFHLEEVKVTAQRIIEKQDTLVYSVAGFSQPQDRSIADVIAKMPGMEVKENGQISFNGKNINKFYIEGLDLMNDRYALASNNISKQRIKSVEVLQNHQPVELLRGKSFSEQAAINLVLEFIDLHKITNYKVIELNTLISRLQLEIDFPAN